MIKYLYLILLLTCSIQTKCISQNWDPFPHTGALYSPAFAYKHFYLPLYNINETDTFSNIGLENAIDLIFEDNPLNDYNDMFLIEFLNDKSGLDNTNQYSGRTWLKTYKKYDNHIEFITESETFKINLNGADTFFIANTEIYTLDTTYYISKIDSIKSSGSDSILYFGLYTLDSLEYIPGADIVISKNNGVLRMPMFCFFPFVLPTYFEGTIEDIYPYDHSKRHMLYKHFPGDEIHSVYEEGWYSTFKTKIYTKKVYVNQTYNSDSTAFINDVDVWTVTQTRTGFMEPFTQTISFNSYPQQSFVFGGLNSISLPNGIPHFLDSNGAFVARFNNDHWEASQWYYLSKHLEILYPHLETGYYRWDEFPTQKYEHRGIQYYNINGVESGNPIPEGFFLNEKEYKNEVQYTLNQHALNLLHPEHFKSGRIYSIDGKFKTYLTAQDLNQPVLTNIYSGLHVLILIGQNGEVSTIKF